MPRSATCRDCGRVRDETAFPPRGNQCIDCRRAWMRGHYLANRDYYVAKARRRQQLVVAENRAWLFSYLRQHPCVDCGLSDVRVLEFDHQDPAQKVTSISVLARSGYSLQRVQEEVAKCEVRCANCHRRRTHEQLGWWGAALDRAR